VTDDQAEVQKTRVTALYDAWVKPLGLAWWDWELVWHRGDIEGQGGAMFHICVRFEYQDITLDISLPRVEKESDKHLERAFCHELGHVFTIPLKDAAGRGVDQDAMDFLEEHQASGIGSALVWLRDSLVKAGD
jgi:hypothetical protein